MNNLWRRVCLSVFIIGIVAYTASFSQSPINSDTTLEPAAPYTVIIANYRIDSNGTKTDISERIRYVKPNGEWKQTANTETNNKKESAVIANTEEGVFAKALGSSERKFISQSADQQMQECFRSVRCLQKQKSFVRIEEVAGLKVYVLRFEINNPEIPIEWVEQSYSPKTGYIPLRNVKHFRDGSEMVEEATKVEFKDVPDNLNDDLNKLPIRREPN
jgi:hypothetical protein